MTRYIFVIGGVMSGVGKGVATASIGRILQSKGFTVSAIKIDPYLNVDAGTMNPTEHGEVFVTEDGMECDQDIGNYERFLDENILSMNYMTSGSIYQAVIERERNLGYHGKCVEAVPHIPEEVINRIKRVSRHTKADFLLIEVGGTIGEYQNLVFLEAGRMMHLENPRNIMFVLVSYLPVPRTVGEMKTKPTQYASRSLNEAGIQPDLIIARSEYPLDQPRKRKISVFCNVPEQNVISAPDIYSIYEVPFNFEKENLGNRIVAHFGMHSRPTRFGGWAKLIRVVRKAAKPIRIGIVGKYFETGEFVLSDSYISVIESVKHAVWSVGRKPEITWLDAGTYEKFPKKIAELRKYDGIIVPGGFGVRGVEGKIRAAAYCREHKVPFLGLCYGMQLAVVEFARNVAGLHGAHTTEVDPKTKYPVIDVLPEQGRNIAERKLGGSMRLGGYSCQLLPGTRAAKAYAIWGNGKLIAERHRHRYELNNELRDQLEGAGLVVSGVNPERNLVEIVELKNHPFFLGTQFHPEFKSRPLSPHPLFLAFIKAALKRKG